MDLAHEWKSVSLFFVCLVAIAAPAQTFTTLDTGTSSYGPLVQGIDGNLYGSYPQGGVGHGMAGPPAMVVPSTTPAQFS